MIKLQGRKGKMIYFDNAATTKVKPEEVFKAFEYYVREIGVSPGRGSYSLGISASRMLYQVRKKTGIFFGLDNPTNVIFTKNSTEAINLFFQGFLKTGDHVVISCYEHNAVLRPLHYLKSIGMIDYSVIQHDDLELSPEKLLDKYTRTNTKVLALTLASNLTGRIIYKPELFEEAKKKNITTFLDASQGAGKISISMKAGQIDYLAFTGHKDLMGLPGTGGLCCKDKEEIKPLLQGGTGILGDEYMNPQVFPEGLEAGTLNMPAIWALGAAIDFCEQNREKIYKKEKELVELLLEQLSTIKNIKIYDYEFGRVGVVGFNIDGYSADEVVKYLDTWGICTRGGIHCAILAHEALKTVKTGVVRVSVSCFNTEDEIYEFIDILRRLGE
ncbi:aminotransferase class V-fold PLP-dependent enzyme [Acetatifactor aquisgranensis]|uniref:aminotransferase class V-fold PLP-dependent enzyme n=1 Tax=Acetatifactor aquisgranensis TaxID=2941233 RepID=UPI0020420795|nr:aminotransferase class V-fold PLP-dependent enzyme [Acetatifactor aquisgranensis]